MSAPELWRWSSYRSYALGERRAVNMDWMLAPHKIKQIGVRADGDNLAFTQAHPSKTAKGAAPTFL